ncbi:hypothetical protein, conserved [Eimeria brunetti]|uniref:Uncharacterized protein n=1 Tax=Eimeria brunetti TaxID=51314 RepID=U6LVA0_9EIME|nr:hypothetical protein, conserved [Eimeria brunetti]
MVKQRPKQPSSQQQRRQQQRHRETLHFLLLLLQCVLLLLTRAVGCEALRCPSPAFCVLASRSGLSPSYSSGVHLLSPSAAGGCSLVLRTFDACSEGNLRWLQAPPGAHSQARSSRNLSAAAAPAGAEPEAEGRPPPPGRGAASRNKDGAAPTDDRAPCVAATGTEQQQLLAGRRGPSAHPAERNLRTSRPLSVHGRGPPPNSPLNVHPRGAPPRGPLSMHSRGFHQRQGAPPHSPLEPEQLPLAAPSRDLPTAGKRAQEQRSSVNREAQQQQQQTRQQQQQQLRQLAATRRGPGAIHQHRDPRERQLQQQREPIQQQWPVQQQLSQQQQQQPQQQRQQQPHQPPQIQSHSYPQQQQQQQHHHGQQGSAPRGGLPGEISDLVSWLRDTKHVLESRVIAKGSSSLWLQLLLPAAAQQLLPARVHVARQLFIRGNGLGPEGPRDQPRGAPQPFKGDPEALWNSLQPGDSLRVIVLGVQRQVQQQLQQQQGLGKGSRRGDTSQFELVVHPILNEPGASSSVSSGVPAGASSGVSSGVSPLSPFLAQLMQQDKPEMTEEELMDRLLQQRVSNWVHFLSPPTATWVVPVFPRSVGGPLSGPVGAPSGGLSSVGPFSRRLPGDAGELRAPPSSRALRCRLVGIMHSKEAAVLEVLGADEQWHEATSSVGAPLGDPKASPGAPGDQSESPKAVANTSRESTLFAETSTVEGYHGCSSSPSNKASSQGGKLNLYQQAERALRLQQQTSRDRILQEELLVQQETLLRKVNPGVHAQQLATLERMLLQNPHLHAYQKQLYSYLHTPQQDAIGALVLLPLRELLTYKRIRKEWGVRDHLRVYFSVFEEWEDPRRRALGNSVAATRGGDEGLGLSSKPSLIWTSIFPAVPLEIAHLLLHDMPSGPLAPYLKLFEQRQLVQRQEEHQQLMQHIQRHHDELARERALRKMKQQQEQHQGEIQAQTRGVAEDRRMQQQKESHSDPGPPLGRNSSGSSSNRNTGNRDSGRRQRSGGLQRQKQQQQHPQEEQQRKLQALQQMLQRIPVKPLWWGRGDWVYREVRLCQVLGPYFYRRLLRARTEEEQRASRANKRQDALDIRGKPFEDLTTWLSTPEGRQRLQPSFVRRYVNALRWTLKVLHPEDFCKAFRCFTRNSAAEPEEAIAKRIDAADITKEMKGLLHSFLPLRHRILRMITKQAAASAAAAAANLEAMKLQTAEEGSKPVAEELAEVAGAHAESVISPLTQLIRLHSYLRLQLRPLQRAPSLAEWKRQQQQRAAQRKSHHRPDSSLSSTTDENSMNDEPELPLTQLQMGSNDEYDTVNKLTDEVEQQMIEFPQDDASGAESMAGSGSTDLVPPLNSAYPSATIRKPRSFYNYFGDDTISLLETNPDEVLTRFAGGASSSNEHELFVPLQLDSQSAAASAASSLNSAQ